MSAVVFAPLVFVADQNRKACTRGSSLEHPRKEFRRIGLFALCDNRALARPTTIQIDHQVIGRKLDAGRHAVNNDDVTRSMAFASGSNAKRLSE